MSLLPSQNLKSSSKTLQRNSQLWVTFWLFLRMARTPLSGPQGLAGPFPTEKENTTWRQTYTSTPFYFVQLTLQTILVPKYFLGTNQVPADLEPGINFIIYSSFSVCSYCSRVLLWRERGWRERVWEKSMQNCFQNHGQFCPENSSPVSGRGKKIAKTVTEQFP